MQRSQKPSPFFIICMLGALSVISPFSIDMYLPAFDQVAHTFGVSTKVIALTISSYFIGMALGPVFYGPLLDRYGRKKPLYAGLGLFILASIACVCAQHINTLIAWRFIQACGGCVAGIASLAMVRDFFPAEECARILSRLFLFIAVSPLLAPSIGGIVALTVGWQSVFFILAAVAAALIALMYFYLPEGHTPDASISLKPLPILREYFAILKHPRFIVYTLSGAFSFAGLFTYVAGSPLIFMDGFHLSAHTYSAIFALLATGFIGGSQLNVVLLRRYSSETLFLTFLSVQVLTSLLFVLGTWFGWYGLTSTLILLFVFLGASGMTYPNAAALAIMPFTKNAGSASSLLGFLQQGVGAVISTGINILPSQSSFSVIAIMAFTASTGLCILLVGRTRAQHSPVAEA
jgi:DHA1 family bicyclomycin/chloramphenicol resistance-like MFS transporter